MFKRLNQAVSNSGSDRLHDRGGRKKNTEFLFKLGESVQLKDMLTPCERGAPTVPASLLTGMYQEWKVVEHKWCRKWPKTPTPDPMLSKIR